MRGLLFHVLLTNKWHTYSDHLIPIPMIFVHSNFINRFGPRFLATNGTYDKELRKKFMVCAKDLNYGHLIKQGVYIMVGGPTFCSTAEARVLKMYGADAVGESLKIGRQYAVDVHLFSIIT